MNLEFEGKLLLFRVLLPLVLGATATWALRQLEFSSPGAGASRKPKWILVGCLSVWMGFLISDFGSRAILLESSQWPSWEAREPWMHWAWVGPLVFSLWVVLGFAWLATLSLLVLGWWMFPGGPGYADQASTFLGLRALAFLATILNFASVWQRQTTKGGGWFGWVHAMHLGCVSLVVLQSYASLGEWLIFSGAMMAGTALYRTFRAQSLGPGSLHGILKADGALTLLLVCAAAYGLCVSRAYSWNPIPGWLLLLLGGMPTLSSLIDVAVCRYLGGGFWVRLLAVMGLFGAMLGAIYVFIVEAQPAW